MSRVVALGLCAVAALGQAGCHQSGSYRLSWDFLVDTSGSAAEQPASAGCGQHGVDAIFVIAVDTTGDSDQAFAICTSGEMTRSVPAGSWSIQIQGIDASRAVIPAVQPTATLPVVVVNDGEQSDLAVTLTPPPACSDGIDNDGDGRVDLADPDCTSATGPHE
jgi:hypothetical protein